MIYHTHRCFKRFHKQYLTGMKHIKSGNIDPPVLVSLCRTHNNNNYNNNLLV